ncbi:MAG: hypothetical protein AAF830_07910 [Pseudomonadota bacterium]
MLRFFLALGALCLVGCASSPSPDVSDCGPPEGWQEMAKRAEGRFLIFGETHGTNEMPALVTSYICTVSQQEGRTLVGLEYAPEFDDVFAEARSADDPRTVLLEGMARVWRQTDGRGSEAMLSMLINLMAFENVYVVFFDAVDILAVMGLSPETATAESFRAASEALPPFVMQKARDKAMAEALIEAFTDQYARAIVLVGGIHASKQRYEFLGDTDNMAMLLPPDQTISLEDRHDAGEAWVQVGGKAGPRMSRGNRAGVPKDVAEPTLGFFDEETNGFDGFVFIGARTASPPALPRQEQ